MAGEAVSARETIDRLTVQLGVDGSKLPAEMAGELAKAEAQLAKAEKQMERAHASTVRAIQSKIDTLNATRPAAEMRLLEQAVQRMGGSANMNAGQVARLRAEITALAAAGAKVPASLQGIAGGKLSQAFTSLTTGGGVAGALSAVGPAGVAAAGAIGAVSLAARSAYNSIKELAGEAERWTNISETTGLGVQQVQQLSDYLEDAGIPAEALWTGMKILQKEIATGGKELEKFGIRVSDLKGLSPEEQLRRMAETIASIQDPAVRTAASLAAFGRSGNELVPVFAGIADGAYEAFEALSSEEVAALKHADDVLDDFGRKWTNFWKKFRADAVEGIGALGAGASAQTPGAIFVPGVGFVQTPSNAPAPPAKEFTPYGPAAETPEQRRRREAEEARKKRQQKYDADVAARAARERAREAEREERERLRREKDIASQIEYSRKESNRFGEQGRELYIAPVTTVETTKLMQGLMEKATTSAGKWARELRNANTPASEIKRHIQALGFSAAEAEIIIREWAPDFDQIAEDGARAGKSVEEIRKELERVGATPEQIKRALHSIGVETKTWGDHLRGLGSVVSGFGGIWSGVGDAIGNAGDALDSFSEAKTAKAQGNLVAAANATKKAWASAAQAGIAAIGALGQALGAYQTRAGGALSGAATGAQAGSSFGIWGMLIGGLVGAGAGSAAGYENEEKNGLARFRSNWDRLIAYVRANPLFAGNEFDSLTDGFAKAQEQLGAMVRTAKELKAENDRKEGTDKPRDFNEWLNRISGMKNKSDWRGGLLNAMGFGGIGKTWMNKLFGKNESDFAGDQLKKSTAFNWEAMFRQAEEWGIDLRSAYEVGGSKLNDALTKYLDLADEAQKQQQAEAELQAQKRRDLEEGLTAAAEGAKMMQEALEKGDFSAAASKAAQELIAKVRAALLAAGMGYQLDKRLEKSEGYQNASQLATGAAQLMAGSRQAGIVDAGMMAAGGVIATEAQKKAYEAAKAAGMSDDQAMKASLGAVSGLLREQLNASIASGKELDDNTKRLLEEAKKNGIDIVADPLLLQLKEQREMNEKLGIIAGQGNQSTPPPGTPPDPNAPTGQQTPEQRQQQETEGRLHPTRQNAARGIFGAASGIYNTVKTPNLGKGLSWVVQTHPDEQMVILPRGVAPRGAVVIPRESLSTSSTLRTAATGVYEQSGGGSTGVPESTGGGSTGVPESMGGRSGTPESTTGKAAAAVEVAIHNQVMLNENPMASAQSRSEARQFTLDAANKALKDGSHPIATTVGNIVDQKIRAALAGRR